MYERAIRFPVLVADSYSEYESLRNEEELRGIAEKIIEMAYDHDMPILECPYEHHHFRYYGVVCYDCHHEEKTDKYACVKYPVAKCMAIEIVSIDEESPSSIKILDEYSEPPGREWLKFHDIMLRTLARIFNRTYILVKKRICD